MSAATPLSLLWQTINSQRAARIATRPARVQAATPPQAETTASGTEDEPHAGIQFYRKHTEKMLRRYLYASMQVGRAPSILGEPIERGWVSCRPVRTFEDAVIFVLDVEACLNSLDRLDRQMLSRIVLQEYTQLEAAPMIGISLRTLNTRFPKALDHLTEKLLDAGLLFLPQ